jgi:hypothetical protein
MVAHANGAFDESGALKDSAIQMQLTQFMIGFVDFVERMAQRSA